MALVEGPPETYREVECRSCGQGGARVRPTTLEGWTVGFRVFCPSCGAHETVGRVTAPRIWHKLEVSHETPD